MPVGCDLAVANNYYCQPLLREMAEGLHVPEVWAGSVPVATQAGYAFGLFRNRLRIDLSSSSRRAAVGGSSGAARRC
jgi:hypothetical protein